MRALGELMLYRPVSGSFASSADEFLGKWAGFATGWTYWSMWIVTAMAELTAVGTYMNYWFDIPQWIPALVALVSLYLLNLIAVRPFGEIEFWFAIIKVVTIVTMIVVGVAILIFGFTSIGDTASVSNLWSHGGFMPKGITGPLLALQMVVFAFLGVELIGVTAGEAEHPEKAIPKAVNQVIWRIGIFYIGALTVIFSLMAWTRLDGKTSPFVLVFDNIGIPAAAGVITFVVITAAASSANSGIFSTGRMLFALSRQGQAPHALGRVSRRGLPVNALHASFVVLLIGVVLNYFVPEKAFTYVTSIATVGALWVWGVIMVSHLRYRKAVSAGTVPGSSFRMPGSPYTNYFVLAFLALVFVLLGFDAGNRIALYVAFPFAALVAIGYAVTKSRTSPSTLPTPPARDDAPALQSVG
jgi:AAT family amino acid transporter